MNYIGVIKISTSSMHKCIYDAHSRLHPDKSGFRSILRNASNGKRDDHDSVISTEEGEALGVEKSH